MTARLLLATRNDGKLTELRRILSTAAPTVELIGLGDLPDFAEVAEVAETGATFAENALLKAVAAVAATGLPSVADDSGLAVDALNGMPGVLSARWSGVAGDGKDEANNRLLLAQLDLVPDERRGAEFVCAAVLVLPDGNRRIVEGRMAGSLLREPRGSGGFGYDPLFVPEGHERTTAELPAEKKDELSHRGKAFRTLAPMIAGLLAG